MAIPTGYEKLAAIGLAYKNEYAAGTAYKFLNAVYYNGATYVALKDNPVTPPVADGDNWQYLAKGFTDGVLSAIEATDTSGLLGTAGATVGAQALVDTVADQVLRRLESSRLVNNLLTTEHGYALDARQGKALKDIIDQQNSDYPSPDWDNKVALTNKVKYTNVVPGIYVLTADTGGYAQSSIGGILFCACSAVGNPSGNTVVVPVDINMPTTPSISKGYMYFIPWE